MTLITITTGNVSSRIERGLLDFETTNLLSEACSYEVQGSEFMKSNKNPYARGKFSNWDGRRRLYHKGHRTFPTGLLHRINDILVNRGYDTEIINRGGSSVAKANLPNIPSSWSLREYQDQSVDAAIDARRCMVKVATGGGKTVMAGHLIKRVDQPTIFLVHTKDLLYQAYDTFISMFGVGQVGVVGDGKVETGRAITVATLQTVAKFLGVQYKAENAEEDGWKDSTSIYDEEALNWLGDMITNSCGLVIMDECHRVAAPTATDVVSAFEAAQYRIGLSASPWRDDGADVALEGVFGHVAVDINASWLIDNDWLVPPTIRMIPTAPRKYPKGTKYAEIYEDFICSNEDRNAQIVKAAISLVKQGRATMVLVNRIGHGTTIAKLLTEALGYHVPFLSGKDDSDTRRTVIDQTRNATLSCFVATTIADEGLDIKPLGGLVLGGGGKSSTRALQRVGRVLRPFPGKRDAIVYDFEDNAKYLYDHSEARLRIYGSEDRFTVIDS